eukprot:TRINITY_DN12264_c0_g1_i1.p1 TRINITY_DN12264_c0_g1~~TRINITY_DN12264_c0_g1_i1.p1  ORF type:complete len:390 (+),score=42.86 TRINITY_DN12264_c0_g1_i1:83-1252(+)
MATPTRKLYRPFFSVRSSNSKEVNKNMMLWSLKLFQLEDDTILSSNLEEHCIKQWRRTPSVGLITALHCVHQYALSTTDTHVHSLHQLDSEVIVGHLISDLGCTLRFWRLGKGQEGQSLDIQPQHYFQTLKKDVLCMIVFRKQASATMNGVMVCGDDGIDLLKKEGDSIRRLMSLNSSHFGYTEKLCEQEDGVLVSYHPDHMQVKWWDLHTTDCIASYQISNMRLDCIRIHCFGHKNGVVVVETRQQKAHILRLEQRGSASKVTSYLPSTTGKKQTVNVMINGGLIVAYESHIIRGTSHDLTQLAFECGIANKTGLTVSVIELRDGSILSGMDDGSIGVWIVNPPNSLVGCCCYYVAQHFCLKNIKELCIPEELKSICSAFRRMLFRKP